MPGSILCDLGLGETGSALIQGAGNCLFCDCAGPRESACEGWFNGNPLSPMMQRLWPAPHCVRSYETFRHSMLVHHSDLWIYRPSSLRWFARIPFPVASFTMRFSLLLCRVVAFGVRNTFEGVRTTVFQGANNFLLRVRTTF